MDRTRRALDEFHIAGLPTNLPQLRAILAHPAVRAGDARTTLLAEAADDLAAAATDGSAALALLGEHAGAGPSSTPAPAAADLPVAAGHDALRAPMDATVAEVRVTVGDTVTAGQTVMVISAMKMETQVVAGRAGVVVAVLGVRPGGDRGPRPGPGRDRPGRG